MPPRPLENLSSGPMCRWRCKRAGESRVWTTSSPLPHQRHDQKRTGWRVKQQDCLVCPVSPFSLPGTSSVSRHEASANRASTNSMALMIPPGRSRVPTDWYAIRSSRWLLFLGRCSGAAETNGLVIFYPALLFPPPSLPSAFRVLKKRNRRRQCRLQMHGGAQCCSHLGEGAWSCSRCTQGRVGLAMKSGGREAGQPV